MKISIFFIVASLIFLVLTGAIASYFFLRNRKIIQLNRSGVLFKDWEMWDQAIMKFEKAISIDPKNALSHYNLGNVLGAAGRRGEAIVQFKRSLANSIQKKVIGILCRRLRKTDDMLKEGVIWGFKMES